MIAVPLASLMVKVSLLMGAERRNGESPAIPIGETTEEVGMVMWKIKARENMTSALRYFKMATSIKDDLLCRNPDGSIWQGQTITMHNWIATPESTCDRVVYHLDDRHLQGMVKE